MNELFFIAANKPSRKSTAITTKGSFAILFGTITLAVLAP